MKRPYGRGRSDAEPKDLSLVAPSIARRPFVLRDRSVFAWQRPALWGRLSAVFSLITPPVCALEGSFPRWGKHSRVTQAPPLRRGTDAGKPPGFCASRRGKAPYLVGRPRSGEKGRKKPEKSLIFPQKTLDPGKTLCYNPFYLSDERFLFARFFRRAQGFPGVPYREAMPAERG